MGRNRAEDAIVPCALQSLGIDSQMTSPTNVMAMVVATPGVHWENFALIARVLLLSRRCRRRRRGPFVSCAWQVGTGGAIRTSSAGTQESSSVRSTLLVSLLRSALFFFFVFFRNNNCNKKEKSKELPFLYCFIGTDPTNGGLFYHSDVNCTRTRATTPAYTLIFNLAWDFVPASWR